MFGKTKWIISLAMAGLLTVASMQLAFAVPKSEKDAAGKVKKLWVKQTVQTAVYRADDQDDRDEHTIRGNWAQAHKFKGKVWLGKKEFKFEVPPVIKEGRILIPVRAISNGLKAQVQWDAETKTVTIVKGDITVKMFLDKAEVDVNGRQIVLDVPAQIICNRTFVPLRFLNHIFKNKVDFDPDSGDVIIEEPEPEPGQLQLSSTAYSVAEDGGSFTVTVTRTDGSDGEATVAYSTSDGSAVTGSDYRTASGTLTFDEGSTRETFRIRILDDDTIEEDETVIITLSDATGATLGDTTSAVLTIVDDD